MYSKNFILETAEENPNLPIARDRKTGQFYTQDKNGRWNLAPDYKQKMYQQKYFLEVKRRKVAEENKIDLDFEKLKHQDKLDVDLSDLSKKIVADSSEIQKYQRQEEDEEEAAARKRYEQHKTRVGSDTKALQNALGIEIKDFLTNLLYKTPKYEEKEDIFSVDAFNTLDPRAPLFQMKDDEDEPIYDNDEYDEIPAVLFFFDRSGSFNERDHKQKTALGNAIIKMFKSMEYDQFGNKQLEILPTVYFGRDYYGPDREEAERDGGNNGAQLLGQIQARTKGRISNVVVLTDHDSNAVGDINICGSFWCIFAENAAPDFYRSVHVSDVSEDIPGKKEYYFFSDIN